jgi:transcriptional regulator with XRE-family HTH domain
MFTSTLDTRLRGYDEIKNCSILLNLLEIIVNWLNLIEYIIICRKEEIMPNITDDLQQQHIGPGQELRQAREAQGMSLEEAAAKLFINKQRLIDIENDDYSRISSLIYARGYLRAYAKLVGLFEDDVLKKFNDLELHEERAHANLDIIASPRTRLDKQHTYVKLVNIAIVVVLVLLVVLWWHGKKRAIPSDQVSLKNPVQQVLPVPLNNSQS